MSTEHHQSRRKAQSSALQNKYGRNPDIYYTNVCRVATDKFIIVALNQSTAISAFIQTLSTCTAEVAAKTLALRDAEAKEQAALVMTDSQAACC